MTNASAQADDLIKRAYVNLTSVRANLPSGYVHEEGFFKMFNQALDELQQAGVDVSEWRMPRSALGNIDGNEFRAKIDAILMYFTVQHENTHIGFRK